MTFGRVWQPRTDVGGGGRDGVVFKITPETQDGPAPPPSAPRGCSGINIRSISYSCVSYIFVSSLRAIIFFPHP